jgi:hypothetical protein
MGSIHEVIATHQSEILHMWTQSIRAQPSARGLTPAELASTIPAYLALLGGNGTNKDNGATRSGRLSAEQQRILEHHLSIRLRGGFALAEILTELTALGRCLFHYLRHDDSADPTDMDQVFASLQLTAAEVTKLFEQQLVDEEQRVKRFTRQLKQIATSGTGLHEEGALLQKRLGEMLAVVMEAMEAQTAALLLLDTKSNQLITSASIGDGDAELERYVRSGGAARFCGKVVSAPLET